LGKRVVRAQLEQQLLLEMVVQELQQVHVVDKPKMRKMFRLVERTKLGFKDLNRPTI
jgi:hypothetical protein